MRLLSGLKRKNISNITYRQGIISKKIKKSEKLPEMVKKRSKHTIGDRR